MPPASAVATEVTEELPLPAGSTADCPRPADMEGKLPHANVGPDHTENEDLPSQFTRVLGKGAV